jgi:hypothetical protein
MQTVLACNLNAISQQNLHRYKDLFRRIQAAITDRRELEDGYVFRLDGDSVSLPDVAQWISLERLCCPFFTFQLQTKGGEPDCWLTLQGRMVQKQSSIKSSPQGQQGKAAILFPM